MSLTQKRLDQIIVQSKRRHKAKMKRLSLAFLGKRAEQQPQDILADLEEQGVVLEEGDIILEPGEQNRGV